MKKRITTLIMLLLLLGCSHWDNLSEAEKDAYRKAKSRYEAGQRGGP